MWLALISGMGGSIWISDREPGIRQVFEELLPDAEVLTPAALESRLALGERPRGLVIDGTQLLELRPTLRESVLQLPRLLVCTGMMLASLPITITAGPGVAVLAKPFCVEDLEAAVEWLGGGLVHDVARTPPTPAIVQRRRQRPPRGGLPAS